MKFMLIIYITAGPCMGDYMADSGLTREDCGNAVKDGISCLYTGQTTFPVPDTAICSCEPQNKQ